MIFCRSSVGAGGLYSKIEGVLSVGLKERQEKGRERGFFLSEVKQLSRGYPLIGSHFVLAVLRRVFFNSSE